MLALHEIHQRLGARFTAVNDLEAVGEYGDRLAEHEALRQKAGVLDLSFRGRLCLTGADRARFLHGQVTNDVNRLRPGQGCYAALVTAKGRMQSDLNIFCLAEELLLDFEPGYTDRVAPRLEKYIVADDVQVVNVADAYGLLSLQGPAAAEVARAVGLFAELPAEPFESRTMKDPALGELCLVNQPRLGTAGFDWFAPSAGLAALAEKLLAAATALGGRACGWEAFEAARIEAGLPRFGQDMDETNFPQECGLEGRAMSYNKGCYIGQEVLNRIHTVGHVNRELRGLRLASNLAPLPAKGDKLFHDGREAGYVTSALASPAFKANIALGYLRTEANQPGTQLLLKCDGVETPALVVELPFRSDNDQ